MLGLSIRKKILTGSYYFLSRHGAVSEAGMTESDETPRKTKEKKRNNFKKSQSCPCLIMLCDGIIQLVIMDMDD